MEKKQQKIPESDVASKTLIAVTKGGVVSFPSFADYFAEVSRQNLIKKRAEAKKIQLEIGKK